MKVILSRKGVDSSAGGKASYITSTGDLICIPIPEANPLSHTTNYQKIQTKFGMLGNFVGPLVKRQKRGKRLFGSQSEVHLDPDLCYGSLPRKQG